MRTNLEERLGIEPEEVTEERQRRIWEAYQTRKAMRRLAVNFKLTACGSRAWALHCVSSQAAPTRRRSPPSSAAYRSRRFSQGYACDDKGGRQWKTQKALRHSNQV